MHFEVHMTVRLRKLLKGKGPFPVSGYSLMMGVNAPDLAAATALAQAFALSPRCKEGNRTPVKGYVERAEIRAIAKRDWPEVTRQTVTNMDEQGVYFATDPAFQAYISDSELARLLNRRDEPLDPA